MRRTVLALALSATLAGPALAQAPVCFTQPELRALAGVATGPLLIGVADKCAATYPALSPALSAARASLPGRFAAESAAAAPLVGGKLIQLLRLGTGADAAASAEVVRALLPVVVASAITPKLDERGCAGADGFAAAILPLTDAQIVNIVAAFIGYAARDPKQTSFRVCDASGR